MILRRTTRFLFALTAFGAGTVPWSMAAAQSRDLDSETAVGRVYRGEYAGGESATVFVVTLAANQALEVMAAPSGSSDPYIKVFDDGSQDLLAENDDSPGTTAARVRLYSATRKKVRIEVSPSPGSSVGSSMFNLMLVPSDYRPNPVLPIALGERHQGRLRPEDEQLYRFTAQGGEVWDFSMVSASGSSLDPALEVFSGATSTGDALASDDDGGEALNSRLRFQVPRRGTYTVRAYGIGGSGGDYTFSAGTASAVPPAELGTLELGSSVTDRLDSDTTERLYQLSADARAALSQTAGALVVEMKSVSGAPLDPVVEVGFGTPLGFSSFASDDDSGESGNARLVVDFTELARDPHWLESLRIKAKSFMASEGTFELSVVRASGE